MEFSEVVRRRRMVRNYEDRPIPADVLDRVLDHARRAPSAGNTQGFAFLVLDRPGQVEAFWDITFPADRRSEFTYPGLFRAPALVVPLAHKQAYLDRYAEPDKGWLDKDESRWPVPYWEVDTAFATMALLLSATDAGLGALFFGIFGGVEELRSAFGIPPSYEPIGAVTLGWPAPDLPSPSLVRGRRPFEAVVHRGGW
ncbi:MAG: nitroreductase family protein [Acidimicrobiia bacterium]